MAMIRLDARVTGYRGDAVRLLGVCDSATGAVLVAKQGEFLTSGRAGEDTVIVTDSPSTIRDWDLAYDERQHMPEVLRSFGEVKRAGRLRIQDGLMRWNPESVLQQRKIDERGTVWEFDSQATENGHVALMLIVWAASRAMQAGERGDLLGGDDGVPDDTDDDGMMPFSL